MTPLYRLTIWMLAIIQTFVCVALFARLRNIEDLRTELRATKMQVNANVATQRDNNANIARAINTAWDDIDACHEMGQLHRRAIKHIHPPGMLPTLDKPYPQRPRRMVVRP